MNLYRIDLTMVATAYLKADTPEDALRIAREHFEGRSTGIEFAQDQGGDLPVCGLEFSDPDSPRSAWRRR